MMASVDWTMLNRLAEIAHQSGEVILAVYATDFSHRIKGNEDDASPVTEADLQADRVIRAGLAQAFPDIPVVSEEHAQSFPPDTPEFFLVDPLDGTKEFLARSGPCRTRFRFDAGQRSGVMADSIPI